MADKMGAICKHTNEEGCHVSIGTSNEWKDVANEEIVALLDF
jgi:hypothetical protein